MTSLFNVPYPLGHCNHAQLLTIVCDLLGNVTFSSLPLLSWRHSGETTEKDVTQSKLLSNLGVLETENYVHYFLGTLADFIELPMMYHQTALSDVTGHLPFTSR